MLGLLQTLVFGLASRLKNGPSGLVHVGTFTVRSPTSGVNGLEVYYDSSGRAAYQNSQGASVGFGHLWRDDTTNRMYLTREGLRVCAGDGIGWSSGSNNALSAVDLWLYRDAANILAQRNGTAAQEFRTYKTWSDASNGEWAMVRWDSNICYFGANQSGSGTMRTAALLGAAIRFYVGTNYAGASTRWEINSSGHFIAGADNSLDIGLSASNRPRNIYAATAVVAPTLTTGHVAAATPTGGTSGDIKVGDGKIWVNDGGTWKSAAVA